MGKKTPKSPRMSLPDVVEKMLEVLEKEGLNPIAPDVMAQHLGYKNAKSGRAATVLGTIRMYGLIEKGPNRKDVISKNVQKFKYTPYDKEKYEITQEWLKNPSIFSLIIEKYPSNLPSDEAFLYELIHDFNFNESSAKTFIQIFKDSKEFSESFSDYPGHSNEEPEETETTTHYSVVGSEPEEQTINSKSSKLDCNDDIFRITITGPNINSTINITELDDLEIVKIMLKKVEKKIITEE